MDKNLFFYELEGRGYIFQNKKWDEAKHVFEDDMLNMAWEMWSSAKHSVKAQAVPEAITIGNELQSWVAVNSFSADDGEGVLPVVDANAIAEKIEELTGVNA